MTIIAVGETSKKEGNDAQLGIYIFQQISLYMRTKALLSKKITWAFYECMWKSYLASDNNYYA